MKTYSRREMLKLMGAAAGATVVASCAPPVVQAPAAGEAQPAEAPVPAEEATILMGTVIRTLSNEYHAAWFKGGQIFADSVGMGDVHRGLHGEVDSEQQLTLMRALLP